ncbi:MAG TPA: riboflavin synthase [Bacillota bacterium]|nr:riboflavin synthase [Bacillota bacterium]
MFTGLIRGIGTIVEKRDQGTIANLKISAGITTELSLGDSIAVNGVCLTVADLNSAHTGAAPMNGSWFQADIMPETWRSSNLAGLKPGAKVNLEPALRVGDHLGGHFVSGHVDGVGIVQNIEPCQNAILYRISFPPALRKYLALKGSIAINGVSLTIQAVEARERGAQIMVSLIPHTLSETNLQWLRPGDPVNLEVDTLARYVLNGLEQQQNSGITPEFLAKNGFI